MNNFQPNHGGALAFLASVASSSKKDGWVVFIGDEAVGWILSPGLEEYVPQCIFVSVESGDRKIVSKRRERWVAL